MTCVCSGLHNDKISKMCPNKFEIHATKNGIKKLLLTHRGSRHSLNADGHYALLSAGFDRGVAKLTPPKGENFFSRENTQQTVLKQHNSGSLKLRTGNDGV